MRCPKCGYVSFDFLNNCSKCSRDLSSSRADLNLMDFRPQVPFLLGSLVGEMEGGGAQQALSLTQETELELGGLGMSEPSASQGSIDMGDLEIPSAENSSEEMSLSDIALDDLETIEASAMGKAGGEELQLDDLAEISPKDSSVAEEDGEFLGLEFESDEKSFEDLGDLGDEISLEAESPPETASADPGASLELDLNEDDLSALAKELEDHLELEDGEKKK
ncbi:MAG: hypothetical protein P8075_11155 [Deltaproteobacteria bacterium]|jgi:hypothetical protein